MSKKILYLAAGVVLSSWVYGSGTQCKTISWNEGRVFTVNAALYKHTHIMLPEPVMVNPEDKKGVAIIGDEQSWHYETGHNHVYVKAESGEPEGRSTTLSVIGVSGNSYDFILNRGRFPGCVRIVAGGTANGRLSKTLSSVMANHSAFGGVSREKYERDVKQAKSKAVKNALRKYRIHIYTRYKWDEGFGFIGEDILSDVYDDGRFTYIRLYNDNKGILSLTVFLNGKEEIVQANYDDVSKMYYVVGIYPKFKLKYGETEIKVSRRDNTTKGAF